jgi:hypothetical protein
VQEFFFSEASEETLGQGEEKYYGGGKSLVEIHSLIHLAQENFLLGKVILMMTQVGFFFDQLEMDSVLS